MTDIQECLGSRSCSTLLLSHPLNIFVTKHQNYLCGLYSVKQNSLMQAIHLLSVGEKKKANIKQDINFLLGIEQSYILDESHSSCTNKQLPKDKYSVTQTCWR